MLQKDQHILTINNGQEEKFLRTRPAAFDFSNHTAKELRELIVMMRTIMRSARGIGLSANQIGLNMQLFIAEIPQKNKGPKLYAIFNPKIEGVSKETVDMEEGCLSVPKQWGVVSRPKEIVLTGIDRHQKPVRIKAKGLLARVIQHETDHLNGILFIDKAKAIHTKIKERDAA